MQKIIKLVLFITLFFSFNNALNAQDGGLVSYFRNFIDVDSIFFHSREPVILMPEVIVLPQKEFRNNRERRRYNRLIRNFKIVYPYAVDIGEIYKNIEDTLFFIDDEQMRRRYVRMRERQIMDTYRPELSKLTLSQGILLVKLLDRQTGSTAFEIVEELKGSVRAFFWQGFALLFGNNLRTEYDADGDDRDIEVLVIRYENGTL